MTMQWTAAILSTSYWLPKGITQVKLATLCTMLVAVSGCTNWSGHNHVLLSPVRPDLVSMTGVNQTARAGDYFLTSWPYAEYEMIVNKSSINIAGENPKRLFGAITVGSHKYSVTVPPGPAILEGQDGRGDRYFAMTRGIEYKYGGWPLKTVIGGLVIPNGSSVPKRVYWQLPENMPTRVSSPVTSDVAFEHAKKDRKYEEFTGFGQTITYIGLVQSQIRFVYKEFQGSTIRDAFTQEFSFDFVPGKEYGYKNARFIVHRATSTEIEYTVLSAFNHR